MDMSSNTVLITGGASGIGLALAERFLRAGSEVIVCGRREDKLWEVQALHPSLRTRVCDVASAADRVALAEWVRGAFPRINVLVNNAGIQRGVEVASLGDWEEARQELAINLEAPIHLSALLVPHLREQPRSALINVTSGLAFAPLASVPLYCATKAALHSFTLSLRHQLADTAIRVVEIVPPAVDTDLGGPGLHTFGVPVTEFTDAVVARLSQGELEVGYGTAETRRRSSREELDMWFQRLNARR